MKNKYLGLGFMLLAAMMLFFAFHVPAGTKVNATTFDGTLVGCGTPPHGICKSSSHLPQIINGEEVFNSSMYINRYGNLVIEFYNDYVGESLRTKFFDKGFYDVEAESRLNDSQLLAALGITDTVLIIPKGRYPVRKATGKYVVTFGENQEED